MFNLTKKQNEKFEKLKKLIDKFGIMCLSMGEFEEWRRLINLRRGGEQKEGV